MEQPLEVYSTISMLLSNVRLNQGKYLIGLTGSGSVGKTSLASIIVNKIERTKFVGSTVRATFKRMGLETESQQAYLSDYEKKNLQESVLLDYVQNFCEQINILNKSCEYDTLVFDRLIADHKGYIIYQSHQLMTDQDYKNLNIVTDTQLKMFNAILYMSYPPPFNPVADGFRELDTFKDLVVDALIYKELRNHLVYNVREGTAQERFEQAGLYLRMNTGRHYDSFNTIGQN